MRLRKALCFGFVITAMAILFTLPVQSSPPDCPDCWTRNHPNDPCDVPLLNCYIFETKGKNSDPEECPDCEVAGVSPSCGAIVKEQTYDVAKAGCPGSKSYKSEWIDWQTITPCYPEIVWSSLKSIAACAFSCTLAYISKDPADIADCIDCVQNEIVDFNLCDYYECVSDTSSTKIIPKQTDKPDGGSCP